jgi:hypothetical protein
MKAIVSVLLGLVFASIASAAMPQASSIAPTGHSSLMQRILSRKERRLRGRTSSSSAASRTFSRPSRRASSSSYSYTGTPVRGVLRIDQVASATSQKIVGSVPYTLMSFDATAANEDIVFSSMKFRAEQGDLSAGTQYTLSTVDAQGGLTPVAYATSAADVLAFTNIDTVIGRDTTRRFVLQGRLIASDAALAVGFLATDPLFVQAQGLQYGRDLAPGIQVDANPCDGQYICRVIVHTQPALLLYK